MNKGYLEESGSSGAGNSFQSAFRFSWLRSFANRVKPKFSESMESLKYISGKVFISTTLMNVQKMFGYRTCNRTIPTRRIWPRKTMHEEKVEVLPERELWHTPLQVFAHLDK